MITLPFKLNRPLAFFDTETTGISVTDKIVQLCILKLFPDGSHIIKSMIVDPGIPIPKEASDVHHITNQLIDQLKAEGKKVPLFKDIAKSVHAFLQGTDLAGFNSNSFDIPLLAESFAEAGIDNWPAPDVLFLDPMVIYKKNEKRDLASAVKFYCGKELDGAHDATVDTIAAAEVLVGQIAKYDYLKEMTIEQLAEESKYNKNVDLAGKLAYDDNGKVIFTFGKYWNKFAYDAFKTDKKYYDWLMGADFSANTKAHFKRLNELVHPPKLL